MSRTALSQDGRPAVRDLASSVQTIALGCLLLSACRSEETSLTDIDGGGPDGAAPAVDGDPGDPGRDGDPIRERPNVLLIMVDDLNRWVGHLGRHPDARTPNIDRLARMGLTFSHAYAAAPLCNPSRVALLGGRRPWSTGIHANGDEWEPALEGLATLPEHFMANGYHVMGGGKLFHGTGPYDAPRFWHEYRDYQAVSDNLRPPSVPHEGVSAQLDWGAIDVPPEETREHALAAWAAERLAQSHDVPFFLAVGFVKPHLPWYVPRVYFDLHPIDTIELPLVREDDLDDLPPGQRDLETEDHDAIVAQGKWKQAVQAYLAATSFVDEQIGVLLDAVEAGPHAGNTIVVLVGDHGWHHGQKRRWRKGGLWEEGTGAPFIWVVPGVTPAGLVCPRTVDFLALYPTLSELAGLDRPAHLEGPSIAQLLADPQRAWDLPAITTRHRDHAVRTEKWRYILYRNGSEELYDHEADELEWTNLAGRPESADIEAELAGYLPP